MSCPSPFFLLFFAFILEFRCHRFVQVKRVLAVGDGDASLKWTFMASWKLLVPGVFLCVASTAFLFLSMGTDQWFVIDASSYRRLCPEDDLFKPIMPSEESVVTNSGENEFPHYATERRTSTQKVDDDFQRFRHSKVDRPASDSPGLPLLSRRVQERPAPLLQRVYGKKFHSRKRDYQLYGGRFRREDIEWAHDADEYYSKLAAWNRLTKELRLNLFEFGGRDLTVRRRHDIAPSGSRGNDCVNQMQKSMKGTNYTVKCNSNQSFETELSAYPLRPKCIKRQFSTYTGLWRTCLWDVQGTLLSGMIQRGDIPRCAPVRYGNFKDDMLPAALSNEEVKVAYNEEWKTLHLRRILTSFLCMAAPVQVFGLLLILGGWKTRRGFLVYAGGLVLVMSGVFQLLAAGTALLLFDAEMQRTPADLYGFPEEVNDKFGRSAQASWVATGCAIFGGIVCALAPTVLYSARRSPECQMNGVQSPFQYPTPSPMENDNNFFPASDTNETKDNGIASPQKTQLQFLKVAVTTTKALQKQAFSLDSGPRGLTDNSPVRLDTIDKGRITKKTKSAPNLQSASLKMPHARHRRGRSSRRSYRLRPQRTLSPVATVRTPQAAVLALEEEQKARKAIGHIGGTSPDSDRVCDDNQGHQYSGSVDDRLFAVGSARPVKETLPYSHSLGMSRQLYDGKVGRSTLTSVDISQRMRHARYARRTFHSCDEPAIRQILDGSNSRQVLPVTLAEFRTRSLPRAAMRHTPLSEIAGMGGEGALREHCEDFLQRNTRPGSFSGTDVVESLRRPLQLSQLGRQHSDDSNRFRMRPIHPAVARWWQEGGRWSKSLDDGRQAEREFALQYQMPSIAREGTLDSVEECAEASETTSQEEIENASDTNETATVK